VRVSMSTRGRLQIAIHGDRARRGGEVGLQLAAEHLLQVANTRVPVEEGTLERSGRATSDGLTAGVSYDTVYAVRQHEELTWRHSGGRTAKYLEAPMAEEADVMQAILAAQIRRALR
jgi:hypothetical protein